MKQWFCAKQYGYGWYPIAWQGWLLVLLAVLAIFVDVLLINLNPNLLTVILGIMQYVIVLVLLFVICILSGPPAKWRWGKE